MKCPNCQKEVEVIFRNYYIKTRYANGTHDSKTFNKLDCGHEVNEYSYADGDNRVEVSSYPIDKRVASYDDEVIQIIKGALMEAEMRQGCSNYTPYAEYLYNQIKPIIQRHAPLPESIQWALNSGDGTYRP